MVMAGFVAISKSIDQSFSLANFYPNSEKSVHAPPASQIKVEIASYVAQ